MYANLAKIFLGVYLGELTGMGCSHDHTICMHTCKIPFTVIL